MATAMLMAGTQAQTQEEIDAYPEYAAGFANTNLTWESFKLKTEDGYTLTVFHVTGSTLTGPYEISKNAVILQHGMGGSGEGWLYQLRGKTPMINYFAEAGFDIWIQNNRGTKYSQEHDLYTTDDREFW